MNIGVSKLIVTFSHQDAEGLYLETFFDAWSTLVYWFYLGEIVFHQDISSFSKSQPVSTSSNFTRMGELYFFVVEHQTEYFPTTHSDGLVQDLFALKFIP